MECPITSSGSPLVLVMLAMLVAFMFLTGRGVTRVAAVALAVIAIPMLVSMLRNKPIASAIASIRRS